MANPESGPGPVLQPTPAGKIAHDIFNVMTILNGLRDEIDSMPDSDLYRTTLRTMATAVYTKLEDVARFAHTTAKSEVGAPPQTKNSPDP